MKRGEDGYRYPIHLTVVSVFAIATLVTAAIAISLQFYFSRNLAIDAAASRYQLAATGAADYLAAVDKEAAQALRLLSKFPRLVENGALNPDAREVLAEVMHNNRLFHAIYVALPNGDLHQLVNLESGPQVRAQFQAAERDRWVLISVTGASIARRRELVYFTAVFEPRVQRSEYTAYDPRQRPWFSAARAGEVFKTPPYLFKHVQVPGRTYSTGLGESGVVLAVDITLEALSSYLGSLALGEEADVYLYQPSGEIIATSRERMQVGALPDAPKLVLDGRLREAVDNLGVIRVSNETDWPPIDYAVSGQPKGYAVDLIRLLAGMTGLEVEFVNGYTWPQFIELFKDRKLDVLQPVFANPADAALGRMSAPFLQLDYAAVTRAGTAPLTTLSQLEGRILAMPKGWSVIPLIREHYPSIRVLETETTRHALLAVSAGEADATLDSSVILHYTAEQYFLDNLQFHENLRAERFEMPDKLHLLVRSELQELVEIFDLALTAVREEHRAALSRRWFRGRDAVAQSADQSTVPYRELIALPASREMRGRLVEQQLGGQARFAYVDLLDRRDPDSERFAVVVPAHVLLGPSMEKVRLSILVTAGCLLLLLPISWLFAAPIVRPIRRLAEDNKKIMNRRFDEVDYLQTSIVEVHDLSHSIVDMAASIQQHERQQRELMESLIQLIAQAIDDKSPYTAGHCARVPQLAIMIAEAASASNEPPFDTFRFRSDDEFREFKIAAWLHDCGKITTPEHIVDKGSKLETIYNRIHEVRTRFEVLWRDAEIRYLRALQRNPAAKDELAAKLADEQAQLQEDFAFVARTNVGGEHLSGADMSRIEELAEITWERHFDDRLGLSPLEALRVQGEPAPLPATEQLLCDRPEHILGRTRDTSYDPKFGIRMDVPEHRSNLGEIYNLKVSRGTLTREDRFKIQEHMISTIKMLESLPFPEELSRVPRYASTHHETLRGDGYPRRLSAEELSMPERIMAVADIFEALTAADRPYKEAKPISESIGILHRMVEANHIDRDVFELFLTSGVYLQYAREHLAPGQIDAVDVARYLRGGPQETGAGS